MNKKIIITADAPTPIGPYNQAVRVGEMLFISGQIAINPATGELEQENISQETKRVMDNLLGVLQAAELSFSDVVKTSIFVKNMRDFDEINKVYGTYFHKTTAPARETVEVSNLPKNVNVEISLIAHY